MNLNLLRQQQQYLLLLNQQRGLVNQRFKPPVLNNGIQQQQTQKLINPINNIPTIPSNLNQFQQIQSKLVPNNILQPTKQPVVNHQPHPTHTQAQPHHTIQQHQNHQQYQSHQPHQSHQLHQNHQNHQTHKTHHNPQAHQIHQSHRHQHIPHHNPHLVQQQNKHSHHNLHNPSVNPSNHNNHHNPSVNPNNHNNHHNLNYHHSTQHNGMHHMNHNNENIPPSNKLSSINHNNNIKNSTPLQNITNTKNSTPLQNIKSIPANKSIPNTKAFKNITNIINTPVPTNQSRYLKANIPVSSSHYTKPEPEAQKSKNLSPIALPKDVKKSYLAELEKDKKINGVYKLLNGAITGKIRSPPNINSSTPYSENHKPQMIVGKHNLSDDFNDISNAFSNSTDSYHTEADYGSCRVKGVKTNILADDNYVRRSSDNDTTTTGTTKNTSEYFEDDTLDGIENYKVAESTRKSVVYPQYNRNILKNSNTSNLNNTASLIKSQTGKIASKFVNYNANYKENIHGTTKRFGVVNENNLKKINLNMTHNTTLDRIDGHHYRQPSYNPNAIYTNGILRKTLNY